MNKDSKDVKNKAELQEEEYCFPYHYIPHYENGNFTQAIALRWGYEYLGYIEYIKDQLSSLSVNSLLDIGCGDGRFIKECISQFPEKKFMGIDISDRAVELAKILVGKDYFTCSSLENLIKEKRNFDCISLIEVIEHIPSEELEDLFLNIKELLNNNGHLIITVPSTNVDIIPKHFQHFSRNSLKELLGGHFHIEKIQGISSIDSFPRFLSKIMTNSLFIIQSPLILNTFYRWYKKNKMEVKDNRAGRFFVLCRKK